MADSLSEKERLAPRRYGRLLVRVLALGACVALVVLLADRIQADADENETQRPRLIDAAKSGPSEPSSKSNKRYPIVIHPAPPTPQVLIETAGEPSGTSPVSVRCRTCHPGGANVGRPPDFTNRRTEDLQEFHQGLQFSHNDLSCLSCHNPNDYESLRMADGSKVEFPDVMKLCAQCHGNVYRDYQHGAHGGMTGHWDLSKGPRERNNCVDCHHPHAPKFPKMRPTFKPRDRFLHPHSAPAPDATHD